jgi:nucleoside-diphosphate-sugar epimerase
MNLAVVTGADGFIGSHLLSFFNSIDIPVVALVMKGSRIATTISSLEKVTILECDLVNWENIKIQISSNTNITFYHLAWSGVSPEARLSIEKQLINVELSISALKLAKKIKADRFVTLGSTMEYMYAGKPIDETALPTPQNAYGAVKLAVRYLCQELAKEEEIPFIYAVVTGVYGANRLDNNVITYTVKKLLQKERPSLTKLEQLWDYIHIDDLVRALYLIGEKGQPGAFYAVGHGDNCPLSQYVNIIHNMIDPTLPLGIGDVSYTSDQLPGSCINLQKLQKDTGFIPEISFEEGIKDIIRSLQEKEL